MEIPVACSLADRDARRQLQEWQALLERAEVEVSRISPTRVELRWTGAFDRWQDLIGLARREKACCPFFDFTLRIGTGAAILEISVPDDAGAILDQFARP